MSKLILYLMTWLIVGCVVTPITATKLEDSKLREELAFQILTYKMQPGNTFCLELSGITPSVTLNERLKQKDLDPENCIGDKYVLVTIDTFEEIGSDIYSASYRYSCGKLCGAKYTCTFMKDPMRPNQPPFLRGCRMIVVY